MIICVCGCVCLFHYQFESSHSNVGPWIFFGIHSPQANEGEKGNFDVCKLVGGHHSALKLVATLMMPNTKQKSLILSRITLTRKREREREPRS